MFVFNTLEEHDPLLQQNHGVLELHVQPASIREVHSNRQKRFMLQFEFHVIWRHI
jgi:hypothetical protein